MPPPVPVPTITPKTHAGAGRGAVAGLGEGEAVGVVREADGTAEPAAEIAVERRPISQVELAFLTRPVAGEMAPGIPTPTVGGPHRARARCP